MGRSGYTLLEVMLATAIGVLLLGALYVALDVQLRYADDAREVVEEGVLARALLTRMGNDISASLPPYIPPKASSSSGGSSGQSSTGSTAMIGGLTGAVQFNLGVQGEANRIALFISRVPRELTMPMANASGPPLVSDLRRVTYWLAGGTGEPLGLARQEIKLVTADADTSDEAVGDEAQAVIAEEVKLLELRYFDGSGWQESWDGTAKAGSGNANIGPPLAIEIKIGLRPRGPKRPPGEPFELTEIPLKIYRHVIAIPTANGVTAAP